MNHCPLLGERRAFGPWFHTKDRCKVAYKPSGFFVSATYADCAIMDPVKEGHAWVCTRQVFPTASLMHCRHMYASNMPQNGVNLAYDKEQVGHSSIKIPVDTFAHLIAGANENVVGQLGDREGSAGVTPPLTQEETYERARH
jgi:hypothetical protein